MSFVERSYSMQKFVFRCRHPMENSWGSHKPEHFYFEQWVVTKRGEMEAGVHRNVFL